MYIYIYIAKIFKIWSNKADSEVGRRLNMKTKANPLFYAKDLIRL
jgi:hypothetical protein